MTTKCGAFQREPLFGTIHYCELAHGHSQSHQGSGGGWSGIWPRVKGDDGSIAISRVEYDAMRDSLAYIDSVAPEIRDSCDDDEHAEIIVTIKGLRDMRAALKAAQ